MPGGFGLTIGLVVFIAIIAGVAALLHYRYGFFARRRPRTSGRSGLLGQRRIEVLESTPVDDERRLVLLRCDRIEHLVLVGGPADLVVENDVKKVRGPGAPPVKGDIPASGQHVVGSLLGQTEPAPAKAMETPVPAAAPAPNPASRPAPAGTASPRPNAPREAGKRGSRPKFPRHEPAAPQPTIQPAPLGGTRAQPEAHAPSPAGRGNGSPPSEPARLPGANVPWAEPDSIESEIVQALRFDPVQRTGVAAAQPPLAPKDTSSPSTTLGDLADRLEQALAEEVQSANQGRSETSAEADFTFDDQAGDDAADERPSREPEPDDSNFGESRRRSSRTERNQAAADPLSTSSESERRRETPSTPPSERREEAPVISLNARRREAGDALEDEMARLLGELTGDTKGR